MCVCVVYEVSGASLDRGVVVLRDIHIDIVDYIQPAACSDAAFRTMWAEFEWENKVPPAPLHLHQNHIHYTTRH